MAGGRDRSIRTNHRAARPDHSRTPGGFRHWRHASVTAGRTNLFGLPIPEPPGEPKALPGLAQPAMQEGQYAASVIRRRVRNLSAPGPFVYRDKGNLAAVGRSFAIADLGKIRLWGFVAWIVWAMVHIWFLIGFANRLMVMLEWSIVYFTGRRAGRAITTAYEEADPFFPKREDRANMRL